MKLSTTTRVFVLAATALLPTAAFSGVNAKPTVEVAFVLDTTGSMGGLIEGAKRKIWSIATAITDANPDADIRMGLVAYRDIGDEYVTNKQMKERNALNEKLAALVAKRDKYVAEARDKIPPKASSFDRVVEDTLKAQIKR